MKFVDSGQEFVQGGRILQCGLVPLGRWDSNPARDRSGSSDTDTLGVMFLNARKIKSPTGKRLLAIWQVNTEGFNPSDEELFVCRLYKCRFSTLPQERGKKIPPPIQKITSGNIHFSGKTLLIFCFGFTSEGSRGCKCFCYSLACHRFIQSTPGAMSTGESGSTTKVFTKQSAIPR